MQVAKRKPKLYCDGIKIDTHANKVSVMSVDQSMKYWKNKAPNNLSTRLSDEVRN